jgi:putative endonuclease
MPALLRLLAALPLARTRTRCDPLGPAGERLAARHLRRRGYRVLRRNLFVGPGEADLVCLAPDRRTIVIVEVKARRTTGEDSAGPPPEAAITRAKRAKLLGVARAAARREGWLDRPLRIDVVAVEWPAKGPPALRHHENVVRPSSRRRG